MSGKTKWQRMSWMRANEWLATWGSTMALVATCGLLLIFLLPDLQPSRERVYQQSLDQMNKLGSRLSAMKSRPSAKQLREASAQARCRASSVDYWKNIDPFQMTAEQILDYLRWTNTSSCKRAHDFGGGWLDHRSMKSKVAGFDGQKAICLDKEVAPVANNCVIYSFGINYDYTFDDLMGDKYGCQVFSFDPSMEANATHNRSDHVHFFKLGLTEAASPDGMYQTLTYIYEMLKPYHGENAVIDYLKMDIESSEWKVIPQMMQTGMIQRVRQLGVELHLLPFNKDLRYYQELVSFIKKMEDYGMVRFDSKINPWGVYPIDALNPDQPVVACYEIAWYNSNLMNPIPAVKQ